MNSRNHLGILIAISLMVTLSQQFEWSSSEEDSYEGTPMLSEFDINCFRIYLDILFQRFTEDAFLTRINTSPSALFI